MKLVIRYCLPWGNIASLPLELDTSADVDNLFDMIAEKLNIPKSKQLLKHKTGGKIIQLLPGYPLEGFGLKDKSIVFLESADSAQKEDNNQLSFGIKEGIFSRQGALDKIREDKKEVLEKIVHNQLNLPQNQNLFQGNVPRKITLDQSVYGEEEVINKKRDDNEIPRKISKVKEDQVFLIKEIKANNLKEVKELFKAYEDVEADKDDASSTSSNRSEIKKLVNGKGDFGWNAFHWAVYGANNEIVQELLKQGANVNLETNDGWTALLIAVSKSHYEVLKLLLKVKGIDVNQVTSRGTAIHLAVKYGRVDIISLLFEHGANVGVKNKQDVLPYEIATSQSIRKLLEGVVINKLKEAFYPPKPPIVKGFMFKKSKLLLQMNKRFCVLNPNDGTFARYKEIEDYPHRPNEIIPLSGIDSIRRMETGPFYKKNLFYIELLYQKRYIFACLNEETANQWVIYLRKGAIFTNFIFNKLKEISEILPKVKEWEIEEISHYFESTEKEIQLDDAEEAKKSITAKKSAEIAINPPINNIEEHKKDRAPRKGTFDVLNEGISDDSVEENGLEERERVNFQSFKILKTLGSGTFGKVEKKDTGKIYAMKVLNKRNLILKNHLRYAVTEANVLKISNNPFILGLHYSFQTPLYLYLVFDYCAGGDLSLYLANKTTLTEDDTRFFIAELVLAFEYLHSLDVIYRDLKPENILIDGEGHIKLADFGLSKEGIGDNDIAQSFCGSPAYLSPEMLSKRAVGKAADIYGIGAVMYELLSGTAPHYSEDIPSMYHNIKKAKLKPLKGVSDKAKNLVTKLLDRDPEKRPGVKRMDDLKKDPFFNGIDWEKLLRKEIQPPKLNIVEDDIDMPVSSESLFHDIDYTDRNKRVNRVKNWSFVKKQNM